MTKQSPNKALVVGTGFGCRIHVPALRAAGFEVVGLVGTRPDKLARKAEASGVPAWFVDLDAAITATGAGLVTIATTPATHGKLALAAIARGCHVLCEKPFAADAAEGRAMVAAAEAAGVANLIAHEFRWMPDRALFGRAIAEGLIGDPRFLVLDQFIPFCADPETRLPRWWFDKEAGGGWLGAGGSHLIDQIRAWLGDFASLSANLMVVSDRGDVADDSYSLRFRLANGVEGSMQQSAGAWGPMTTLWRCAGTHGTVWADQGKVFVADKAGTRELPLPDDLRLPPPPPAADPNSADRLSHLELGPFTRLCEALRDRIEGRDARAAVAVPTFRDGLASMEVIDAIRASAAQGGALMQVGG
ncbi:Gfo/Idh/MocA family protein [Novosphingobium album (ex Liu et al. 2023)]|uniref:Gfo/Idh/MocA family oxidoreductase n=1 Tax=Novosphingobium album (ex Liu et al. 2023) TaxID=3031130 RepID=A0ABT5WWA1_9SPHN|nr:Gfo/Idh/MocA family oxidoreductase [Novosphingobium album (ex Liu et al. 2023)]MDE8654142.1 Gfo/Idh/MocA family oxidoreductase [Novosphingobium album (ex Liu et al. 2023)]